MFVVISDYFLRMNLLEYKYCNRRCEVFLILIYIVKFLKVLACILSFLFNMYYYHFWKFMPVWQKFYIRVVLILISLSIRLVMFQTCIVFSITGISFSINCYLDFLKSQGFSVFHISFTFEPKDYLKAPWLFIFIDKIKCCNH